MSADNSTIEATEKLKVDDVTKLVDAPPAAPSERPQAPSPTITTNDVTKPTDDVTKLSDDVTKDDVVTEAIKEPGGAMEGLEWTDGVGVLPGSDLKFRMTEDGELEMITEKLSESDESPAHDVTRDDVSNDSLQEDERTVDSDVNGGKLGLTEVKQEDEMEIGESDEMLDSFYGEIQRSFTGAPKYDSTCLFCGRVGDSRTFCGRFCSKQCIAKNAGRHKRHLKNHHVIKPGKVPERKRLTSYEGEFPAESGRQKDSGDLKIKIRLPSTGGSNEKRRKASIISDDVANSGGGQPKRRHVGMATGVMSQVARKDANRRRFMWNEHLEREKAQGAPGSVFRILHNRGPYPESENRFRVGQLLEAVDPNHQSMICLVSVVSMCGHRLRLHFEGYPSCFNFWVNADSPFIFPCGFCERTGRTLAPPCGYDAQGFRWRAYTDEMGLHPAPGDNFVATEIKNKTKFEVNDKLEAVDRKHPTLTCVATVIDIIGDYILIHFDGWDSDYDYWAISTSNYVRPIGWCKENEKELSPPLGFAEGEVFDWKTYLRDHKAAESDAFVCNPHGFSPGMRVEVVDQRNPVLLRVATVAEVDDYRVKIHFDGWSDMYDDWLDADSSDLHPPGWASRTNHPLQPPLRPEQLVLNSEQTGCPIPGCNGIGHVRQDKYVSHHSEFGCPYSPQNLGRDPLPDRLNFTAENRSEEPEPRTEFQADRKTNKGFAFPKRKRGRPRINSKLPERRISKEATYIKGESERSDGKQSRKIPQKYRLRPARMTSYSEAPLYRSGLSINQSKNDETPNYWHQHVRLLPGVDGTKASQVTNWSTSEVSEFVKKLTGKSNYGDIFVSQEIDGEALLMLTQTDISSVLKLKLGPSVKIYNAILMFKVADKLRN
uniref:Lethal(3)malignant brain tumor-like protein 4 n=1 Tax=Phallusia mammillata TaxID=59560 RepID=A0A6F9DH10_9ASCI|nr:lethal(3)malignant brain tumor-like protein 4 [Phallusia mammillata]